MSVKLRIDKPKKYWWSSTSIWTVPGSDPTGPQGSPNVGETTFIWAKVENLGDVADEFITVKFYVGNPSTVMTPTTTTTIGTSFASIPPHSYKNVLCVVPWKPTFLNQGHECIIVECYSSLDSRNQIDTQPFNASGDPKIAQRNLHIEQVDWKKTAAVPFEFRNVPNFHSNSVILNTRLVDFSHDESAGLLRKQLPTFHDIGHQLKRSGLIPGINSCEMEPAASIHSEVKSDGGGAAMLVATFPSPPEGALTDSSGHPYGAMFITEQIEPNSKQVVGGLVHLLAASDKLKKLNFKWPDIQHPPSPAPFSIPFRPFAVNTINQTMNPDGIFVSNMGTQIIEAHLQNESKQDISNVKVYIEGTSDPGIQLEPNIQLIDTVKKNTQAILKSRANFVNAAPGLAYVSFIVSANGSDYKRIIKKIFITKIILDDATKTFSIDSGNGKLTVKFKKAIFSDNPCRCDKDKSPYVILPTAGTYTWIPNQKYTGKHGDLPFGDPCWWKILLALIALALAAGSVLVEHYGHGHVDTLIEAQGTLDESKPTAKCCDQVTITNGSSGNNTADAIAAAMAAAAGVILKIAIASDDFDFHWRGQEATQPRDPQELTLTETVVYDAQVTELPTPGKPFKIPSVDWKYTRVTNKASYEHSEKDTNKPNIHFLGAEPEIDCPTVWDRKNGPLLIRAKFLKANKKEYYTGNQLYAICWLLHEDDRKSLCIELKDDGIASDTNGNDGKYTGTVLFPNNLKQVEFNPKGFWYGIIICQDVDTTVDGTDPIKAAQTIGGTVINTVLELNMKEPCRLNHQFVVQIL